MRTTFRRPANIVGAVIVVSVVLVVGGGGSPAALASCDDPFVYDPRIDETVPMWLVDSLESAIPPLQPGDKRTHRLKPWTVFCRDGRVLTPQ
jgi:hypothetical protein